MSNKQISIVQKLASYLHTLSLAKDFFKIKFFSLEDYYQPP